MKRVNFLPTFIAGFSAPIIVNIVYTTVYDKLKTNRN